MYFSPTISFYFYFCFFCHSCGSKLFPILIDWPAMSKACAVLRQKWRMSSALRGVSFDPAWGRRGHFTWLISTRFSGWGSLVRVWMSSRSNTFNSVLETELKVVAGWTCVFLCTSIHKNTQRKCFGPGIHSVSVVKTYFKSSTRFNFVLHARYTVLAGPNTLNWHILFKNVNNCLSYLSIFIANDVFDLLMISSRSGGAIWVVHT